MKLPTSVTVLGQKYAIQVWTDPQEPMGQQDPNATSFGWSDHARHLIRVRDHGFQSPQAARDTLLHEVVHAVDFMVKTPMEEADIHRFSAVLLDVLRSNPKIVSFLLEP